MAFQVSPGVNVAEIDLTTRVPVFSVSDGGFVGKFTWGPIDTVTLVSNEDDLVNEFGKPNANNFKDFFTCSNFLSYSDKLRVVRIANTHSSSGAFNAVSNGSAVLIRNDKQYENTYDTTAGTSGTNWFGKYAGELGNSLKISVCMPTRANTKVAPDGTVSLDSNTMVPLSGTFTIELNSNVITGTASANVAEEVRVGDVLKIGTSGNTVLVTSVTNSTSFTAVQNTGANAGGASTGSLPLNRFKRSAFEESSDQMLGVVSVVTTAPTTVSGTDTAFKSQVTVGDIITVTDDNGVQQQRRVSAIGSNSSITVTEKFDSAVTNKAFARKWEYRDDFDTDPLTSTFASDKSGNKDASDEIHVIIVDEDGKITGTKDKRGRVSTQRKSIIETYPNLSVANSAIDGTGVSIFYKDVINADSNWVRWGDHSAEGDTLTVNSVDITSSWGSEVQESNSTFRFATAFGADSAANGIITESFSGGSDGNTATDADVVTGLLEFKEPGKVDVSLLMTGEMSNVAATFAINEIAENRKDCMVFISPESADVVNKTGSEVTNVIAKRNVLPSTSYATMDGNYKYQLDRFNGVFRYVPLNGDIAGLCAQSDNINPFISPAGFTRGNIKNVVNLAYNPSAAERDDLYVNGINPVVSFPGQGTVLFGDKTLLARPSAFDRINVRRLFIAIEKSIAPAAQFSLFEFNDEFTRAQFVAQVEPFLRDIQSARGIIDFKVICDAANNPPSVIDRNEFRGDIFIKPNKSINFIQLNFVAVSSGVEFSEVVNAI